MSIVPPQPVQQKPPKPARDKAHLERVRSFGCVVCDRPAQAHHCRVGDRTMGKCVSDHQSLPLCEEHHTELHEHWGQEEKFWRHHVDKLVVFAAGQLVER